MNAPARSLPTHAPQTVFAIADGELQIAGQPLSRLAARVGRTPFYAYDRGAIARRVAELRAALPPAIELHYAMKANPMPALVGHLARLVDGIDVASAGELQVALDAGADPQHVSFAVPASATPSCARRWPPASWSMWNPSARSRRWPRPRPRSACRRGSQYG